MGEFEAFVHVRRNQVRASWRDAGRMRGRGKDETVGRAACRRPESRWSSWCRGGRKTPLISQKYEVGDSVGKVAFTGHKQATSRVSCRAKSQVSQRKQKGASLRTSHLRMRQRGSPIIRRPMRTHPSRRFFFPLLWPNRLNAAPEFLVCRRESEGHGYSAECFDPGRPPKGIGRDIKCHRRACRNHSAFANR